MLRIFTLVLLLLVGVSGIAQQRMIAPVVVNFTELARRAPAPAATTPYIDGRDPSKPQIDKTYPENLPIPANAKVFKAQQPVAARENGILIASPTPSLDFNGLTDVRDRQTTSLIPPDTHGAVGRNQIVSVTNGEVKIHNKSTGALVGSIVTLNSFWSSLSTPLGYGVSTFDPKVIYDPLAHRFIFTVCANSSSANSAILVGVSQSEDPSGNWNLYGFDADAGNANWFDYPSIGFNRNLIVITGNMFSLAGSFQRTDIYVFDKAQLYSGQSIAFGTNFQRVQLLNNQGGTINPVLDYDHNSDDLFMLQSWNSGTGYIKLSKLTGSINFGYSLTDVAFPQTNPWQNSGGTNFNFAPQIGSTRLINTNDSRMQNAVLVNGKIWAAHTIHLPVGAPTRSAIQWWSLSTAGAILQNGLIDDTEVLGPKYRAFPTICANKNDEVLIGYTVFSAGTYPSAAYSYRAATDAAGTMREEHVFKTGLDVYVKTFSADVNARNRWGDYSNTMLDPQTQDFWTVQQYAETRSTTIFDNSVMMNASRWSTWWARIPAQTSGLTPLPISLSAFTAAVKGKTVVLNWETASEINFKEFVVERSVNGVSFSPVGTVTAKGSNNTRANYTLTDIKPLLGKSYYRLRMIDKDGTIAYSKAEQVNIKEDQLQVVNVKPVPAVNNVYLEIYTPAKQKVEFSVFDMSGKLVNQRSMTLDQGYNVVEYPVAAFATGNYKLVTTYANGRVVSNIVKQ